MYKLCPVPSKRVCFAGGVSLTCVKVSPQTKEDRVENLRKCLTFLLKRGCDIGSADPVELEDGNLKSSLLLVGNIRNHFQVSKLQDRPH